jgi:sigma-54 dependent transcriptional regulator, flagellar regulatory protein
MTSRSAPETTQALLPTGQSAAICRVNRLILQVAAYDSNVLILGESGTGKEVVARAIHASSSRRNRPFIPINCGAIPAELLESELFGHEKGAFTGALSVRKGRFELAEGGTIFLDEIGDMNPTMQVKLLRVLQERVYERVGSCSSQRCDVRIIAATHRDLEARIAEGSFREDLYYRLNVVPVELPPLRERAADLPLLIAALGENIQAGRGLPVQLLPATVTALQAYRWPGNVRELGNLLERLAIECAGQPASVADLPARYRPAGWVPAAQAAQGGEPAPGALDPLAELKRLEPGPEADGLPQVDALPQADADGCELPPGGMDLRSYLENLERRLIAKALDAAGGTVAHAARLLGLRRTTLVEKLRKYELTAAELSATGT